jgi:hypothetical protein
VRERALIHVAGPAGAGKTTFIERLLDAGVAYAICVRTERDATLRREQTSAPRNHAELRRYRDAGASAVALYRFADPDVDAFFTSDVMQGYSDAVFIEGDCPIRFVDLSVFIAPPPAGERALLERVVRDHATAYQASIEQLEQALESSEVTARLFAEGFFGDPLGAMPLRGRRILDDQRRPMKAKLDELRQASPPPPTEYWVLGDGYAGIERAQLVIVNVRSDAERQKAQSVVVDVARLRKDQDVFLDVLGRRGNKLPITTVVADLSNPKDAGLKKALARVKRAMKRRQP